MSGEIIAGGGGGSLVLYLEIAKVVQSVLEGPISYLSQNPLVGESISSNRLNPAWDHFPMRLSVVRPVSS